MASPGHLGSRLYNPYGGGATGLRRWCPSPRRELAMATGHWALTWSHSYTHKGSGGWRHRCPSPLRATPTLPPVFDGEAQRIVPALLVLIP